MPHDSFPPAWIEAPACPFASSRFLQVNCSDFETFLWSTEPAAVLKYRWFISSVAVRVEAQTPPLLVAKIAESAEMRGCVAEPFDKLCPRFRMIRRRPTRGDVWFYISIDIAELTAKTDVETKVLA